MLKKVAIVVVVLALLGAVAAYVLWRQATALPEWAEDEVAEQAELSPDAPLEWEPQTGGSEDPPSAEVAEALRAAEADPQPGPAAPQRRARKPRRKAKRYVLKGFHRKGKGNGKTAVRASRAVLEGDELEAGVVLDLSRLKEGGMSESDRSVYERAIRAFPSLKSRNVYVGIEDHPVQKDGVLQLGSQPKLRVGNLRYDLGKAAAKLDMSEAELRRSFNRELRRLGFKDPQAR